MVWYGMVWYGMVWYGMVWCGKVKEFFELFVFFYFYVSMGKYDKDNITPTYIFTVTLPRAKYLCDFS
jgi:hypothetical protein